MSDTTGVMPDPELLRTEDQRSEEFRERQRLLTARNVQQTYSNPANKLARGEITEEQFAWINGTSGDQYQRALASPENQRQLERRMSANYKDLLNMQEELESYKQFIKENQNLITEDMANTMSRAYMANPTLNPEVIVASVFAGADEQTIYLMASEAAQFQMENGLFTDDQFEDFSSKYPWVTSFKDELQQVKSGKGFAPAWAANFGIEPTQQISEEWWKAQTSSRWHAMLSEPSNKNLGPLALKISEEEMERRQPPEANWARVVLDWALRRERNSQLPPAFRGPAEIESLGEASVAFPNLAMISAVDLFDTILKPLRWSLDKTTPDAITDPVSGWMRSGVRWGFGASQLLLDMPENIIMAATANPEQAHLGFRAEIAEKGVLEGLGAGVANAFLATAFGQGVQDIYTGQDVDTGSGFFMGGSAQEEADKLKMFTVGFYEDQEGNYLRTRSFGTTAAEFMASLDIVSQDDYAYNIISGGIDAAFELFADPTNYIPFGGWGDESIAGLKALNSRTSKQVAELLEESKRLDMRAINEPDPVRADAFRSMSDYFSREALEAAGINTSRMNRASVRAKINGTTDQELAARSFLLDESGVIRAGNRRTVVMPEFAKFLVQGRGQRLIKRIEETTDATEIKELFRYRIGNTAAQRLADADNANDVIKILVEGVSNPKQEFLSTIRMIPNVGLFSLSDKGLWIRRQLSPVTRMGNMLPPGTILDPSNGDDMVLNVRQILDVLPTNVDGFPIMRYDQDFKKQILNQFIKAFADGDMGAVKKAVGDLAKKFEEVFVEMGYQPHIARELTRYVQNADRLSSFRWTELASDVPINKNVLLLNDLLSSGIMIIDNNRFLDVVRRSGRFRNQMRRWSDISPEIKKLEDDRQKWLELRRQGKDAEADKLVDDIIDRQQKIADKTPQSLDDEFNRGVLAFLSLRGDQLHDFWKTFTIARMAYPLRVVPEETGRVLLTGVFRNWVDYFATVVSSSERMNLGGRGRYLSDASNRRFVRKTHRLQELENQFELETQLLDELRAAGRGSTPEAKAIQRKLDEIDELYIAEQEAWDRSFNNYQVVQLGDDRVKATRTITRRRAKQAIAQEGTAVANRNNSSQAQNWVDGVIERVLKLSKDQQGANQIARAALGLDVAKAYPFEMNGVVSTVKEHLARGENFEEVMANYFVNGIGRKDWETIAKAWTSGGTPTNPDSLPDALQWVKDQISEIEYIAGLSPSSRMLQGFTPAPMANVDPDILRAIATARFKGRPLQGSSSSSLSNKNAKYVFNPKFREHIELWAFNPNAPDQVLHTTTKIVGEDQIGAMEKLAGVIFGQLYGVSSDILARSPTWRRLYWKQVANVIRSASPEAAQKLIANAEKAKIDKKLMQRLKINAKMGLGDLDLDDIDDFARGAATGLVRDLLFDANRKGATADALRLVVAFGDAWYEVMKTWTRANLDRKGMPIKSLMKGIGGGRDFSMFGSMGPSSTFEYDPETGEYEKITSQKRQGFFYRDPTTDQEMFGLPMSNKLLRTAAAFGTGGFESAFSEAVGAGGSPGPFGEFRAPLEGLNVFGTLSPGVGPYGSMIAEVLVPNTAKWDWLADILYPYGRPIDAEEQSAADVGVARFMPPYVKRALIAMQETVPGTKPFFNWIYNYQRDPSFINLQANIAKSLVTTGNYGDSVEEAARLKKDVRKASGYMLGLWAIASFIGPAAPSFRPLYQTRDPETGEIMGSITSHLYAQELNDLRKLYIDNGEDPNQAPVDMAYTYGPYMWLSDVPNSQTRYPGQEQTQEWWDWYRTGNNQEFMVFENVGAFFGAVNGERNNDVANQMRSAGLTPPKDLPELIKDGQRVLAYRRLDQWLQNNGLAGRETDRTPDQRVAIALYKNELERYYNMNFEDTESKDRRDLQLSELERIVDLYEQDDPLVAAQMNTDFGQRVLTYMVTRRAIIKDATRLIGLGSPNSWVNARAAAPLRDRMRELGVALSQGSPAFARLYQFVLENEMLDVDEETMQEVEVRIGGVR